MKILIVDNDINTVEVLQAALLRKVNHEISVAYGGKEALETMKKNGSIITEEQRAEEETELFDMNI